MEQTVEPLLVQDVQLFMIEEQGRHVEEAKER
jgi:hypothetical protein